MAYATEAGIAFLIGGIDTTFFTSANIALAILHADVLVDSINSGAAANDKIYAANMIGMELMLHGRANLETKGLASDAGHIGSAAKSISSHEIHIHPSIYALLKGNHPRPVFKTTTPSLNRDWS